MHLSANIVAQTIRRLQKQLQTVTYFSTTRLVVQTEFPTQLHFEVLSAYLLAVSRPFELSLQSSLQLSLTVLVCYRYHQGI